MKAALILLLAGFIGAASAQASVITLSDQNSTAQIDPSSQAGMYSWTIDGNNILNQQWFWYRVGATGGQQSLDAISAPVVTQFSPSLVQVQYASSTFRIDVNYSLYGGTLNSGIADMGEQIRITNLTSSSLDFHFFEYSNFGLSAGGDSAVQTNGNTMTQKNQFLSVAETVDAPGANHWQISYYPVLLNELNGGLPLTLSDTNNTTVGDITWGLEWDVIIAPGGTFLISKDKEVSGVPEPGILLLLGVGLIAGGLAIRKRF